jgi:hypothetical protein
MTEIKLFTITVVKTRNGYVGVTASDRWNLEVAALDFPHSRAYCKHISRCTSKGQIDALRRELRRHDIRLVVARKGTAINIRPTDDEMRFMDDETAERLSLVA